MGSNLKCPPKLAKDTTEWSQPTQRHGKSSTLTIGVVQKNHEATMPPCLVTRPRYFTVVNCFGLSQPLSQIHVRHWNQLALKAGWEKAVQELDNIPPTNLLFHPKSSSLVQTSLLKTALHNTYMWIFDNRPFFLWSCLCLITHCSSSSSMSGS